MTDHRRERGLQGGYTPATVGPERASLVVHWPDGRVTEYPLGGDSVRVGRAPESNDLVIPEEFQSISREHLEFRRQGSEWRVVDLDTTNGVFIQDERVQGSAMVGPGDQIRIGAPEYGHAVHLEFRSAAPGAGRKRAAPAARATELRVQRAATDRAKLEIHLPGGRLDHRPIDAFPCLVGRGDQAQIRLDSSLRYASVEHFEIRRRGEGFELVDLDSSNGTWLNGRKVLPHQPQPLNDQDRLRIGDEALGDSIGFTFRTGEQRAGVPQGYTAAQVRPLHDLPRETVLIGRDEAADIQLASPTVSRQHAMLERRGEAFWIRDLDSLNGTVVNGEFVQERGLREGDVVEIQDHALVFRSGELHQFDAYGVQLEGRSLTQRVQTAQGERAILDDVSLTIRPREFVALVGPSGAGKSTLMHALMGVWPAEGEVRVNGRDLYADYERFRRQIGYVPQDDILHTSLTVERALDFAARLRLPPDLSHEERSERIGRVLDTVAMNDPALRQTRIEDLSGGQRKRVSIAAELLADPKLFFLDEATSGLDPGLEKQMMHTLRRMADEGRTVVLITHATANIVQADYVAFLSEGKLTYFGPPNEALTFFDVEEFADIYERIHDGGESWREKFLSGEAGLYDRYVGRRSAEVVPEAARARALPAPAEGLRGFLRQLRVLTERTFSVLTADRLQLSLLLLMFPLAALFLVVVSSPDILTGNLSVIADPPRAASAMSESYSPYDTLSTFIFTVALDAVLIGMFLPSNELLQERVIYLRERMVNLGVAPYVLSKVVAFTTFIAIQAGLSILILSLGVEFPDRGAFMPFGLELFLSLFLTMLAGVGIGLLISAVSRTPDMATYILVIVTFFQFFFSATAFDLRGHPTEALTYTTATRWSMLAVGSTVDVRRQAESTILCQEPSSEAAPPAGETIRVCRHFPEAVEDLILDYRPVNLPRSWGVLSLMALAGIGLTGVLVRRVDPL